MNSRKIVALILVLGIIFSINLPVIASNETDTKGQANKIGSQTETVINEADMMLELNNRTDNELMQSGYSLLEIENIRNYRVAAGERIGELALLSREVLENKGYSSNQINAIYNYNGSDSQLRLLAGEVRINISINSTQYDEAENMSHARIFVSFTWITEPLSKFTDVIGIAWNSPMTRTAQSASILYEDMDGIEDSYYGYTAQVVLPEGPINAGVGFKFPMKQTSGATTTYYAKSGNFVVVLETPGHLNLAAYTSYGHYSVSVSASIALSIQGGLSISFSPTAGYSKGDDAYTSTYYI